MKRKERIEKILTEKLNPEFLFVKNNSALHAGHLGDDGTGETHFLVEIKSQKFNELSRVNAHKIINQALKNEFNSGLHALEIKIK
jgi:BolA protein